MQIFRKPEIPAPPPPPVMPNQNDSKVNADVEEAAARERKSRGRASTLFTGGAGLTEPATVSRRSLIGF